jgi:hypothetical protein
MIHKACLRIVRAHATRTSVLQASQAATAEFSDYIVFVDESGNQQAITASDEYPVFVLAFCIFRKQDYISDVLPAVGAFKLDYWGHDLTILHGHRIRQLKGEFAFLFDLHKRQQFMSRLSSLIVDLPFMIVAAVADKRLLRSKRGDVGGLYTRTLLSCLRRTSLLLAQHGQSNRLTHVIVESRGRNEDAQLRGGFDRIRSTRQALRQFELMFSDKKTNSSGLQIADLVAQPIGRYVVDPTRENRAYAAIAHKLVGGAESNIIMIPAPALKSERPRFAPRPSADRELPIHLDIL